MNFFYIKKMVELILIPKLSLENLGKCEVCVESNATKKILQTGRKRVVTIKFDST